MQEAGLRADQVSQVRGFADQCLRNKAEPLDASNRRISIIVQYTAPPAEPDEKVGEKAAAPGEEGGAKSPADPKAPAEPPSEKK
jgi:chemotaxis protein MotB